MNRSDHERPVTFQSPVAQYDGEFPGFTPDSKEKNIALVLSGGIGSRMKSKVPKQYLKIKGLPIIYYTLRKFSEDQNVNAIIIVAEERWRKEITRILNGITDSKFAGFAEAGVTRQGSIVNGLHKCMEISASEKDVVIIHDAVRPMVSVSMIDQCIHEAHIHDGCMPVIPVSDTIYKSLDGRKISELLDRNTLFAGQAPEAFNLHRYATLNFKASAKEINSYKGSTEIAFQHHMDISLIPGEDTNFKITTPADIERLKTVL